MPPNPCHPRRATPDTRGHVVRTSPHNVKRVREYGEARPGADEHGRAGTSADECGLVQTSLVECAQGVRRVRASAGKAGECGQVSSAIAPGFRRDVSHRVAFGFSSRVPNIDELLPSEEPMAETQRGHQIWGREAEPRDRERRPRAETECQDRFPGPSAEACRRGQP
jgi:hypothetical protein